MFLQDPTYSPFSNELDLYRQHWQENATADQSAIFEQWLTTNKRARAQLTKAFVGSEFLAKQCCQNPAVLIDLIESDWLSQELSEHQITDWVAQPCSGVDSEIEFDRQLRLSRRKFMLRTIWRDLNCLADMEQTTAELSYFAQACIQAAVDFHFRALTKQHGVPIGEYSGAPQPFLVLGMGKLGAYELNRSSDIDLIFTYPEAGTSQGSGRSLSNQEFYLRLGQKVIKSLDTTTADGFVFRVDMRLRPWGQSGALVANFDALENYYQTQGREWERYAMIKARVVACTSASCFSDLEQDIKPFRGRDYFENKLMALLLPFTYRKYLDFSAIEAMRSMKQLITKEVSRRGLQGDVKLGPGGIREVEFIVQVFQLIRGGRDLHLRERNLLKVLPILEEENYLPSSVAKALAESYHFLRNTEHVIQAFQDKQTQQLPADEKNCLRMALMMGFGSWQEFLDQLDRHRQQVNQQFQAVIADPDDKEADSQEMEPEWSLLWQGSLQDASAREFLQQFNIDTSEDLTDGLQKILTDLRDSHQVVGMQAAAREKLDQLMPHLLADLVDVDTPVTTLQRVSKILEAVARRSVYIVLLLENPGARVQLIKLCNASPWISQELAEHPVLLDELLDARSLYSPPDIDHLRDELRREVLRIPWDDLEAHMEALRYFRSSHALRVAACEVTEILPLMKVSDYLTYIAEVILEHVLVLAWQQMVARYGRPGRPENNDEQNNSKISGDDREAMNFIIVAYGKLGGIELGHGSDLDLVFIHDADINLYTDGPESVGGKSIDNATFFARLGQKIIHILNTHTVSGQLYEVDMRLRPSGNSGLLVSSLTAFEKYQREDAWVWEHQALVRARVVAGSETLNDKFDQLRRNILCQQRDLAELREKVVEMREKMRKHLGSKSNAGEFNIKQDTGGIVDIEFMVQYAVLAWAQRDPALVTYTDNIRILEGLQAADFLDAATVDQLIEAYKNYRSTAHRLALQGHSSVVSNEQFAEQRASVSAAWEALMGS